MDCSLPGGGGGGGGGGGVYVVPGDIGEMLDGGGMELRSDARYVIIVEKDAVFNKLAQERVRRGKGSHRSFSRVSSGAFIYFVQ